MRLARAEGLLEGLVSHGGTNANSGLVAATEARIEAYKEAIELLTASPLASYAPTAPAAPLVPYVSAFDPTSAPKPISQPHVKPYLAAKAARIAAGKK